MTQVTITYDDAYERIKREFDEMPELARKVREMLSAALQPTAQAAPVAITDAEILDAIDECFDHAYLTVNNRDWIKLARALLAKIGAA